MLLDVVKGGSSVKPISIVGLNDFHGQLESDDAGLRRDQPAGRRRRLPGDDVRRGVRLAARTRPAPRRPATTSVPRRRTRPCSRTCRRSTSRTHGASTPRPTATTSSTTGSTRLLASRHAPSSRSWPRTSSRRRPASARRGSRRRRCSPINGIKVGVIGAELQNTPELVSAGATEPVCVSSPRRPDQGRVRAPREAGRPGPGRGHPPGHERRQEPARQRRRAPPGRARSSTSPTRSRGRRSTR